MVKENFIRLLEDSFRKYWDLNAYTNYGEKVTYTYAEVAQKVAELHIVFEECNIKPNDKISLVGKNAANWCISYIATVTYGAVIVPILHDFNPNDIHHIINHSESKLLIAGDNIWENLEEEKLSDIEVVLSLNNFRLITILNQNNTEELATNELTKELINKNSLENTNIKSIFKNKFKEGFHPDSVRYDYRSNSELVCINYTSGTTGFSKGVMITGNALAGNITFAMRTKIVQPGYRIVSFLPLAHTFGCTADFLITTTGGCHVNFIGKVPSPKVLLQAFAEIKPNIIFCVPLIIEKIYKKQIQPLLAKQPVRWVLSIPLLDQTILTQIRKKLIDAFGGEFTELIAGGAPLNSEVEDFFHKIKFPFSVGYGMTECAPLISFSKSLEFVPKSSGRLLDNMEVKIMQPDPNTGVGEICVRGENLMIGYYKNPEATSQIIDKEGWLHTGDLGTVDENENIFIRGRNKTMILSANGQNIFPEEIEAKLNNLPYILESLVIESKSKLIALVYPDYEAVDAQKLNQIQL